MGKNLPQERDSWSCLFICGWGQLASSTGQLLVPHGMLWKQTGCSPRLHFPRVAAPEFAALALVFGTVVRVLSSINVADVTVQILKKLNQTRA